MQIRDTFATTIQKRIEPVVKVIDRQPDVILNELSSLVVTPQWERYLRAILDSYADAADRTDEPKRSVTWAMAPNTEPSFPVPQSYAETCRLVSTWCQIEPTPGGIPDALRRPLAFPRVPPGADCPVTSGHLVNNGQFGGLALGEGPVQPIAAGGGSLTEGLRFRAYVLPHARPPYRGWYSMKTLWFARPEYRGPVFIRGRQLDGPHTVVLGEGPSLVDPQLGPGDTLNGIEGWREWPGGTSLRTPGCYAWQVDGTDFSHVIVFKAVFR